MRQNGRKLVGVFGVLVLAGYAVMPTEAARHAAAVTAQPPGAENSEPAAARGPVGLVETDITDILGRNLAAKVELHAGPDARPIVLRAPEGRGQRSCPTGAYEAFIYVYSEGVPILVEVKDLVVREDRPAYLLFNLLEGAAGLGSLQAFDQDFDLAIDSVELKVGTDPADPVSIPGRTPLPFEDRVLSGEAGWYRGELHARSIYGAGRDGVAELVKRAEKGRLDFLAITDRNTMAACRDPAFKSGSVVLVPAMEWGSDGRGVALIYGPRTFPEMTDSVAEAQAMAVLVQAQGGVFAIAHPCFPTAPWQWGLDHVNAVEVWCREWRAVPPVGLDLLNDGLKERRDGKLVHSIALAAVGTVLSANGQAALFWDHELRRGLKASPIGGSMTSSKKVPMGSPVTYVYAAEKSVRGILDGLQKGRTFVSESVSGPTLGFSADSRQDGVIDGGMGEIIPVGKVTDFYVTVRNAKGKKVEVLLDGSPIISRTIESNNYALRFTRTPDRYSIYRVQVIDSPSEKGFGLVKVLAMSSPIYAQEIYFVDPERGVDQAWVKLKSEVPPIYVKGVEKSQGKVRVRIDEDAYRRATPTPWEPPKDADVREITPRRVF